jgi:ABC-type sugar transport system permease subunit
VTTEAAGATPAPLASSGRSSGIGRRLRKYQPRDVVLAYALLLPSALVFFFFFFEPFGRLVGWGRYQPVRGGIAYRDVGIERYQEVLGGQDFRDGLTHSITFVLLTVPIGLILGVLLAVAAHRKLKGIKVFQTIFSSTIASSVAVSSVLFLFILNRVIGVFRGDYIVEVFGPGFADALPKVLVILLTGLVLAAIVWFAYGHGRWLSRRPPLVGFGVVVGVALVVLFALAAVLGVFSSDYVLEIFGWRTQPQNWAQETDHALWAAALPSVWQNLGLSFVIVLAGLQAIPDEVVEAATLDGYGPGRRFFRITLPLISPVLLFLVVVLVVFGFQAFAQVEVITNGGPAGASETLVYKIFYSAQDLPKAAIMSVGLFFVTLVVSAVQFTLLNRRVHYGDE